MNHLMSRVDQFAFLRADIELKELVDPTYTEDEKAYPAQRTSSRAIYHDMDHDVDNEGIVDPVQRTFEFIFTNFKKGIYARIAPPRVHLFAFSNTEYTNKFVCPDAHPRHGTMRKLAEAVSRIEKRPYISTIHPDPSKWYANNALMRYEYPMVENGNGVKSLENMFEAVARILPVSCAPLTVFINKRDYPIRRKDGKESYTYMFGDGESVENNYVRGSPILSMCTTNEHEDIAIPTWDDWARVNPDTYFGKESKQYTNIAREEYPWNRRRRTALFRGSSSGFGLTPATNPRLRASIMSLNDPQNRTPEGPYLDAGITRWNARPRKLKHEAYLDTFDENMVRAIPLVNPVPIQRQGRWRYILHLEGHVESFRLSYELGLGSVVLLPASPYKLWFSDQIMAYQHYVPVAADLSDLYDRIQWCRDNDDTCRVIAQNARAFYNRVLSREGILNYMRTTLARLSLAYGETALIPPPPAVVRFYTERAYLREYPRVDAPLLCRGLFPAKRYSRKWYADTVHEAFTGISSINPLLAFLPGFQYTHSATEHPTTHVMVEQFREDQLARTWRQRASIQEQEGVDEHIRRHIDFARQRYVDFARIEHVVYVILYNQHVRYLDCELYAEWLPVFSVYYRDGK